VRRIASYLGAVAFIAICPASLMAQSLDSAMDILQFDAARNDFFAQADTNLDLRLSQNEMTDALGLTAPAIFDGQDYDGDGYISYSEYLDSGEDLFATLDRNGDGVLTPDEY